MGLFGKKKREEEKPSTIESIGKNNEELQDLLNEFKEMRAGITRASSIQEESHDVDHLSDTGEEYELSEEESESIENFLSGTEEDEPEYEEEVLKEDIEEEILEEDIAEEEVIEEEPIEAEEEPEAVDVEVTMTEMPQPGDEEIVLDEEQIEELEEEVEEAEETDYLEEEVEEEVEEVAPQINNDAVTAEELDKKFADFENRLMTMLSMQLAKVNSVQTPSVQEPKEQEKVIEKREENSEDDELEISSNNGNLVINGFEFSGEVVMFTPITSVKKASWEEVVRRKGHCTYHLTTSGNGGWFIKKSNAPNPYAYIEKKEEAEELARIYAKREKAELKIHNAKGVIEKSLSFGREKLRG